MTEAELRRAILCERGASIMALDGMPPVLTVDCPGDCMAHLLGYRGMYVTPLRTLHGYATPTRGDLGLGWPDLCLIGRGRVVFAELKSERGDVRPEQWAVGDMLRAVAEWYVWRPKELDDGTIYRTLADGPAHARRR